VNYLGDLFRFGTANHIQIDLKKEQVLIPRLNMEIINQFEDVQIQK